MDPAIAAAKVRIGGTLCEAFPVAIWSKGNVLTVLMFSSKSLKLLKSGYGSPTKGELRGA